MIETHPTHRQALIVTSAYLACIVGANAALKRWGFVPIGFGLTAPAGVYLAGLSFGLRDAVQEVGGRVWTVAVIVIGAGLSWLIEPSFAVASGAAFLLSELADFAVYTPLRERRWAVAVVASNIVGSISDSILFLWIAFESTSGWVDLTVGKIYMIAPAVVIVGYIRRHRR